MKAHSPRPRILVAEPEGFSARAREILDEVGEVELRPLAPAELPEALAQYDVVWFRLAFRIDHDAIPALARCRILATPVTGLDRLDLDACRERGIRVISLKGESEFLREVRATAELTVALALALMRRIVPAATSVLRGEWDRDRFRGRELYGKTVGIVGVGRLGKIVAGYLEAIGMELLGFDPHASPTNGVRLLPDLRDLLRNADLVTLHVPYEPATRHLIGREELACMREDAVLVNTSRGGVVDERALLAALRDGRIGGAALDVLDGEPEIGADHPLVRYAAEADNLLIVPHIGGNTVESFEKTEVFLAGRVRDALREAEAGP